MPNHSTNVMTFNTNTIDYNKIFGNEFSYNNIVPKPTDENVDLYEWCCDNWGTKWDVYDFTEESKETKEDGTIIVKIVFKSAWCPPFKWADAVKDACPNTEFEMLFSDEFLNFFGFIKTEDHEIKSNIYNISEDETSEDMIFLKEKMPYDYDFYKQMCNDEIILE